MSESQFRSKIYWVTFCFSIFVIWVHSTNWELFLGQPGMETEAEAVRRVEYFFGERLGQMAVPGFFLVSAYLFYRNFTMDRLLSKQDLLGDVLLQYFCDMGSFHKLGVISGTARNGNRGRGGPPRGIFFR